MVDSFETWKIKKGYNTASSIDGYKKGTVEFDSVLRSKYSKYLSSIGASNAGVPAPTPRERAPPTDELIKAGRYGNVLLQKEGLSSYSQSVDVGEYESFGSVLVNGVRYRIYTPRGTASNLDEAIGMANLPTLRRAEASVGGGFGSAFVSETYDVGTVTTKEDKTLTYRGVSVPTPVMPPGRKIFYNTQYEYNEKIGKFLAVGESKVYTPPGLPYSAQTIQEVREPDKELLNPLNYMSSKFYNVEYGVGVGGDTFETDRYLNVLREASSGFLPGVYFEFSKGLVPGNILGSGYTEQQIQKFRGMLGEGYYRFGSEAEYLGFDFGRDFERNVESAVRFVALSAITYAISYDLLHPNMEALTASAQIKADAYFASEIAKVEIIDVFSRTGSMGAGVAGSAITSGGFALAELPGFISGDVLAKAGAVMIGAGTSFASVNINKLLESKQVLSFLSADVVYFPGANKNIDDYGVGFPVSFPGVSGNVIANFPGISENVVLKLPGVVDDLIHRTPGITEDIFDDVFDTPNINVYEDVYDSSYVDIEQFQYGYDFGYDFGTSFFYPGFDFTIPTFDIRLPGGAGGRGGGAPDLFSFGRKDSFVYAPDVTAVLFDERSEDLPELDFDVFSGLEPRFLKVKL